MATAKVNPANDFLGTGRRKSSVARVRLRPGTGKVIVNKRELNEFFTIVQHQRDVLSPLIETGKRDVVEIWVRVDGGGITGQSGACKLGISRAKV
jgi:small subunit ribosomal protein S9